MHSFHFCVHVHEDLHAWLMVCICIHVSIRLDRKVFNEKHKEMKISMRNIRSCSMKHIYIKKIMMTKMKTKKLPYSV